MHIVALNGSPHRKGNTATLMQSVLDGCAEVVRPLVEGNPEQFAGVLAIWEERESRRAV